MGRDSFHKFSPRSGAPRDPGVGGTDAPRVCGEGLFAAWEEHSREPRDGPVPVGTGAVPSGLDGPVPH